MLDQDQIDLIRKRLLNPWLFRAFELRVLPMGFLTGMKIARLNDDTCEVHLRHFWLIKNPFGSTFWAVLGMAAEMSTGALLVSYTWKQSPNVSFILVKNDAQYYKKARGKMRFICDHSVQVKEAVILAGKDSEKHKIQLPVRILNAAGELIAEMTFTWMLQCRTS